MNRPTRIRGTSRPPLAIVGSGTDRTDRPELGRRGPDAGSGGRAGSPPPRTERPGRDTGPPPSRVSEEAGMSPQEAVLRAELRQRTAELQERTADLQRLKAEYDNYRKRVRRDRLAVGEIAVANVLGRLLPVLDAVEEAAGQGEVTGGFGRVARALVAELTALGLTSFGSVGDAFDPVIHEAVTFTAVSRPETPVGAVCTEVLRRGYLVGDQLLRPAQVSVTGEPPAAPARPSW
ncbi:nucleotide exchange factor GrpE [Streptomyces sp. NPDC021749]|uniref:nucleotide exchange factor GrpE n=1 Tax=Streptomyces sp. NPDC021749 TaxID=3154905 RepID=UPI0033C92713